MWKTGVLTHLSNQQWKGNLVFFFCRCAFGCGVFIICTPVHSTRAANGSTGQNTVQVGNPFAALDSNTSKKKKNWTNKTKKGILWFDNDCYTMYYIFFFIFHTTAKNQHPPFLHLNFFFILFLFLFYFYFLCPNFFFFFFYFICTRKNNFYFLFYNIFTRSRFPIHPRRHRLVDQQPEHPNGSKRCASPTSFKKKKKWGVFFLKTKKNFYLQLVIKKKPAN